MKSKKRSEIYTIFLLLLVLTSCRDNIFQNELISFSSSSCEPLNKELCLIDFTKFTKTEVDSIIVFDAGTTPDDITRFLGITYENYKIVEDETKRIIFLYNGNIVKEGDVRNDKIVFLTKQDSSHYFCKIYRDSKLMLEKKSDTYDDKTVNVYVFGSVSN